MGAGAALLLTAVVPAGMLAGETKAGDTFPDLAKEGLEGTLPDLTGKILVVDFWASWCGPCRKALPLLSDLHKEYSPKGVVFIAVSLDEDRKDMDAFLKKSPIPFAVVRDPKGKLASKLSVEGIPTSFVVGKDGKVHAVHVGFEGEKVRKKYSTQLDTLLAV